MASSAIRTFTGKHFDVLNPDPDLIDIKDIAHALSCQGRFSGHTREFYSVAQHSCLTATVISHVLNRKDLALTALLHDATEAYLIDLPRPIKHSTALGEMYSAIEDPLWVAIARKFGLPEEMPPEVKLADNICLKTEMRDLMGGTYGTYAPEVEPLNWAILPWEPIAAETTFIFKFHHLGGKN